MTVENYNYPIDHAYGWGHRDESLLEPERVLIEGWLLRDRRTLEGGTGAGRILANMCRLGFSDLHGYDYVQSLIAQAHGLIGRGVRSLTVQTGTQLAYRDCSFDQVVYLQQFIGFMPGDEGRVAAAREAYRVLTRGGTAVFSFLNINDRNQTRGSRTYVRYLRMLRAIVRSPRPLADQPWLRVAGKPNLGAVFDRGPYVHWFEPTEACELLERAGFQVRQIGDRDQIVAGDAFVGMAEGRGREMRHTLYIVCVKPA
jgi:SAM-dependent methyltransferase